MKFHKVPITAPSSQQEWGQGQGWGLLCTHYTSGVLVGRVTALTESNKLCQWEGLFLQEKQVAFGHHGSLQPFPAEVSSCQTYAAAAKFSIKKKENQDLLKTYMFSN